MRDVCASLVKQVANVSNDVAGDGTTCATVLTRTIFIEGCKSVAAGMNVMDLRRGINMALDAVVTSLKSRAKMIGTSEVIAQLELFLLMVREKSAIAKAMEKVGKEGVITIADGKTLNNELEVVEGMQLDRGYISPYFITNQKSKKYELGNPLILIHAKKISNLNAVVKVLELALKMPVYTIAANAGVEGAVVVGKLLDQDNPDFGYDAAKGTYVNMIEAGIIDPLKVIRTALVDAAGISSLMKTTEAVIVELPKDEKEAPVMGGGISFIR